MICVLIGVKNAGGQTSADFTITGLSAAPDVFPGYPYSGQLTFNVRTPLTIEVPANTFAIIITGGGAIEFEATGHIIPEGWEIMPEYTGPDNFVIKNIISLPSQVAIPTGFTLAIKAVTAGVTSFGTGLQELDPINYRDFDFNNHTNTLQIAVLDNALPVKLISFKASEAEGLAHISWTTAEEKDFGHFEVERSLSPENGFASIGKVSAKGVNGKGNSYGLTDREAPRGQMIYYRLKMVDLDGSHVYSRIESLELSGITASVYPNPAREFLKVKATEHIRALELINMAGVGVNRTFYEGNRTEETLELRNVGSGVYQLKITGADGGTTYRKIAVAD